jgi:hypothetical protein
MLFKERCEAANVEVVKRALFITRNSLKLRGEKNLFPSQQYLCHNAKVVLLFEAEVLQNPRATKSKLRVALNFP